MAKLTIDVKRSGGTKTPEAVIQIQDRIAKLLEKQNKILGDQLKRQASINRAVNQTSLNTQKAAALMEKSMVRAAVKTTVAWKVASKRIKRSLATAFSGIGGSLRTAGAGISGILGSLSGGLGGLVRGAGGLASVGTNLAGGIVSSLSSGLLSGIPVVGGALSGLIGGAVGAVTAVAGGVLQAVGNLGGAIVDKLLGVIKVGLLAGIGLAVFSAFKAAKFERLQSSFKGFTKSIGVDSVSALNKFRAAAKDTVSDVDLITKFNNAIALGAANDEESFVQLIKVSRRLAKAVGRDLNDAFTRLTLGIGKNEQRLLDEIGLKIRARDAQLKYAASIGKTVKELSAEEKTIAFRLEVFRAAEVVIKKAGKENDDFTDSWKRITAQLSNVTTQVGLSLLPAIKSIIDPIARVLIKLRDMLDLDVGSFGKRIKSAFSGIADTLNNLARVAESEEGINGVLDRIGASATALWIGFSDAAGLAFEIVQKKFEQLILTLEKTIKNSGFKDFVKAIAGPLVGAGIDAAVSNRNDEIDVLQKKLKNAIRLKKELIGVSFSGAAGSAGAAINRPPESPTQSQGVAGVGGLGAVPQIGAGSFGGAGGLKVTKIGLAAGALTARAAQIAGALAKAGVEFEKLPEEVKSIVGSVIAKASSSAEETGKLLDRLRREATRSVTERMRDEISGEKEKSRKNRKLISATQKLVDAAINGIESTQENLAKSLEKLDQKSQKIRDSISSRVQSQRGALESRTQGLADSFGGGTGIGASEGLPLNIVKAIRKVRKQKRRARFDQLRRSTTGLGSNDLAANGGALLEKVLRGQAETETKFAEKSSLIDEAGIILLEDATKSAEEKRKTLIELADKKLEKFDKNFELQKSILDAVIANEEKTIAKIDSFKADLKAAKKALRALGANL